MQSSRSEQPVPLFRFSQNSPDIELISVEEIHIAKPLYTRYCSKSYNGNRKYAFNI